MFRHLIESISFIYCNAFLRLIEFDLYDKLRTESMNISIISFKTLNFPELFITMIHLLNFKSVFLNYWILKKRIIKKYPEEKFSEFKLEKQIKLNCIFKFECLFKIHMLKKIELNLTI